jgi:putative acetyltransferase
MVSVREEEAKDVAAIRLVNERAFGRPEEADLVDRLRAACGDLLSLVAEDQGEIVGHILFSPATIESERGVIQGVGLAPMAVLPERQRQGVGSALVKRGLSMLRERGVPFVIVLGHPDYYPLLGFERASNYGLRSQWAGVPDAAFMVLRLNKPMLNGVTGVARYRQEFDAAM